MEVSGSYDVAGSGSAAASVLDEWECQQAVLRFTAHSDAGEHRQMEQYSAPEGFWHQALGLIHGLDELRERLDSLPPDQLMRHVLTNLRTTITGRDEAVVDSYFVVYLEGRSENGDAPVLTNGPRTVGRYRDSMRRLGGRWLICERQVTFDMKFQGR